MRMKLASLLGGWVLFAAGAAQAAAPVLNGPGSCYWATICSYWMTLPRGENESFSNPRWRVRLPDGTYYTSTASGSYTGPGNSAYTVSTSLAFFVAGSNQMALIARKTVTQEGPLHPIIIVTDVSAAKNVLVYNSVPGTKPQSK